MEIEFCLAAKTYMYLPLYLAEEKGIFDYLISSNLPTSIVPYTIKFTTCEGDTKAVSTMLIHNRDSRKNADRISIAIADPVAVFDKYERINSKNDIRIIGQLINQFPFWIITNKDDKINEGPHNGLSELKDLPFKIKHLYAPNETYITANTCAKHIKSYLDEETEFHPEENFSKVVENCMGAKNSIGLSGDLNKIAKLKCNDSISIAAHMCNATSGCNIATAIITTKYICKEHGKQLIPLILEAIQNAIFIIYSSPEIAEEVCVNISKTYLDDKDNRKTIEQKTSRIIKLINDSKLYPMTTDIKQEDWLMTINYYLEHKIPIFKDWYDNCPDEEQDKQQFIISLYHKMFYRMPALEVERKMIVKFGVDCSTFDMEIPGYLRQKRKDEIKRFIATYLLTLCASLCIVISIITLICLLIRKDNIDEPTIGVILTIISLLITIFGLSPRFHNLKNFIRI